ncbi:MAG: tRNA-dihydrouridine synthase family protein [Victivallales bacterium]
MNETRMTQASINLSMAPIHGITDAVYRQSFAQCFSGFDRAVAPFIQPRQGKELRSGDLRQLAQENNRGLRTVPQVLVSHAETFAATLKELHGLGFDEVNWNMGCPYPTVADRGRGAGLMPHPDSIDAMLGKALDGSQVKLSVKLRLGYVSPDEFIPVLEVLNRYPLSEVIMHPRTAGQMYEGALDLERARHAMSICKHPFIFNGDITTAEGFEDMRKQFSDAAGWMIGRGALSCPFLPAMLKGAEFPSAENRLKHLRKFHELLFEGNRQWQSGMSHLLDKMFEQWDYLSMSFSDPHRIRRRIRKSRNIGQYYDAVGWSFEQELRGK